MRRRFIRGALMASLLAAGGSTHAAYRVFTDQAAFEAATGAVSTGLLPALPGSYNGVGTAQLSWASVAPLGLVFGPSANTWSTLIAGPDLAINGAENFNVTLNSPGYAMGIQAHEPTASGFTADTCGIAGACTDTTFQITILSVSGILGVETVNFANDTLAFFGVWSDQSIHTFQVRDMSGSADDEFFGQVFRGTVRMSVPEPGNLALMGLGLVCLAGLRRQSIR